MTSQKQKMGAWVVNVFSGVFSARSASKTSKQHLANARNMALCVKPDFNCRSLCLWIRLALIPQTTQLNFPNSKVV